MARKADVWFRSGRGWYTTLNGKQIPLGVFNPDDVKAAREAFDRLLAAAQQIVPVDQVSTDPPEPVVLARAGENWDAKVAAWIGHKTALKLKAKTLREYRWNLGKWLAKFGGSPRSEVTANALEEHSHSFGWGVNQRRHYIRTVTGFLSWCGLTLDVPCPGHQSAGANSLVPLALHERAVSAAPGDVGAILRFMWDTGCRPCEACSLVGESVDRANGTVHLREHKTASAGKVRILYLAEPSLEVLEQQRAKYGESGPVFRTRKGVAYLRTGLTATLVRLSGTLGARITAYGYRHSYATRALELGLPDTHVAALLGHSSTKMIHAHYSHINANARLLKDAAAKVSGRKS